MHRVIILLCTIFAAIFAGVSVPASADQMTGTYTNDNDPFNSAINNGNGTWDLSSAATTYSYVGFLPSQTVQLSQLTNLSTTFTDNLGGVVGGAPRLEIDLSNDGWILVYLGTPPNFDDPDPANFTAQFSGLNLDSAATDAAYENGNTYVTLSSLEVLYGQFSILDIYLIVDGGWARNMDLTMNSINAGYSPVPEPGTLALFGIALLALGGLGLRRKLI